MTVSPGGAFQSDITRNTGETPPVGPPRDETSPRFGELGFGPASLRVRGTRAPGPQLRAPVPNATPKPGAAGPRLRRISE